MLQLLLVAEAETDPEIAIVHGRWDVVEMAPSAVLEALEEVQSPVNGEGK